MYIDIKCGRVIQFSRKGKFYRKEVLLMKSINEVSDILGIKVRTVREWIKLGKIKAEKSAGNNRWYIPDEEIERTIKGAKNKNGNKD